jgi:hypothetical protein
MVGKKVKICLVTLALLIGLSTITPAAFATEKGSPRLEEQNIYTPAKEELKQLGLSDIEIKQLFGTGAVEDDSAVSILKATFLEAGIDPVMCMTTKKLFLRLPNFKRNLCKPMLIVPCILLIKV